MWFQRRRVFEHYSLHILPYESSRCNNTSKKYLALISDRYPVQSAYLFGSFAKGFIHDGSDIDVCIVSPVLEKIILMKK